MSPMGDCDESTAGDINGIGTPNLLLGLKEMGTLLSDKIFEKPLEKGFVLICRIMLTHPSYAK